MQAHFIAVLAETGSVRLAAASVSKTHRAAYQLRRRADGRWFAVAWDAALLIRRDVLADVLMDAAHNGVEMVGERDAPGERLRWRRADPDLGRGRGMAQIIRLDKAAARIIADRRTWPWVRHATYNFQTMLTLLARGAADSDWQAFYALARTSDYDVSYGYFPYFPGFSRPKRKTKGRRKSGRLVTSGMDLAPMQG